MKGKVPIIHKDQVIRDQLPLAKNNSKHPGIEAEIRRIMKQEHLTFEQAKQILAAKQRSTKALDVKKA
jgi:hypothetical protein